MNAPTDAQKLIAEMDAALHTMLDENEELRAERDQLRAELKQLLDWVTGDRDALHCLQSIYNSPHADQSSRIKAAAAARPLSPGEKLRNASMTA